MGEVVPHALFRRRRRGSVAIEAALIFPVLVIVAGVQGQYMVLAKARMHAEHAAYAAARSALVHKCKPLNLSALTASPLSGLSQLACSDDPQAWNDAARWALIAAAPVSDKARGRGGCAQIPAATAAMEAVNLPAETRDAFENRLCYVHESGNVTVDVAWEQGLLAGLRDPDAHVPIRATVRFRYPVTAPIGMWLADGKRGDGTRYIVGEATVVLS